MIRNTDRMRKDQICGLQDLCQRMIEIVLRPTLVEVGSYFGISTVIFAAYCKEVIAVDSWDQLIIGPDAQLIESWFNFRTHGLPITKIKDDSCYVAKTIRGTFDGVYIDGSHDYESVKRDIVSWLPKADHFISGHDYCTEYPGVMRAVNETFNKGDIEVFSDTSWLVRLK